MQPRTSSLGSAMNASYAKNEISMKSLLLFQLQWLECFKQLEQWAGLVALEQKKLICGYILRRGIDSILSILSTLITMCGRSDEISMGQRMIDIYIILISRRPNMKKQVC